MKKLSFWLSLSIVSILLTTGFFYYSQESNVLEQDSYEEEEEREGRQSGVEKQLAMWLQAKAFPDPYYLGDKYARAWEQAKKMRDVQSMARGTSINTAQWMSIGPSQTIGGRILTIAIDPNNPNNLFIGSASGGIWKSTTAGSSWSYVETGLPVLGVASIVYHPTDSKILLAGTGEVYRTGSDASSGYSNIGFNVWKARGTYGVGILRSTDGGVTWQQTYNKNTKDMFAIQMLKYHPTNSNIVYACATDGLYRSTDAGITWTLLLAKNYVSDVAINPANPNQIVITVGNLVDVDKGIYRSTDGGATFNKVSPTPTFKGYIRLDYATSTKLYASIGGTTGNELYWSTDFGATWTAAANSAHCGGQYWFGHDLAVDPANENYVVMGGVRYYTYTYTPPNGGGKGTENVSTTGSNVHADVHDIKFDPKNSQVVYIACDGGMYKSTNRGTSWSNINNGLFATQFYASIAPSPTDPKIIIGGLQDNGVIKYNGTSWTSIEGGDGGPSVFHPTNGNIVLYSNDARAVFYSSNAGSTRSQKLTNMGYGYGNTAYDDRTAFMSPVAISKSNPSIMYVASDNLHISTDGGGTFQRPNPADMTRPIEQTYKTAIAMAVSHTNPNKVYVSTSPFSQKTNDGLNINGSPNVLVSTNASDNNNYTFTSIRGTGANVLPNRFVMDFAIDPVNDNHVYVVLGGFGTSHIYETTDGGANWYSLGSGGVLPDVPFNAVLIDPVNPNVLYVGTDFGVYVSPNKGQMWYDYNNGFKDVTLVMDIQATADKQLVVATHGKGAYLGPLYSSVLPVTISSFNGVHTNGVNQLTWRSESELDFQHYEVERSSDGVSFLKIGTVAAMNKPGVNDYQFYDKLQAGTSNKYYYRLKCVDIDKSYSYSKVIALQILTSSDFTVLQNPFGNQITVHIKLEKQSSLLLSLYDDKGRLLKQKKATGGRGTMQLSMDDLSYLPGGIYFLQTIIDKQSRTTRLIKK